MHLRLRVGGKHVNLTLIACVRKFLVILSVMLHNKLAGMLCPLPLYLDHFSALFQARTVNTVAAIKYAGSHSMVIFDVPLRGKVTGDVKGTAS